MAVYKHECKTCIYLGTETLHEQPADIYYCTAEQPFPTIIVRIGNEEHEYSSMDVVSLLQIAHDPGNKTNELMVQYYKTLTIEQARILH